VRRGLLAAAALLAFPVTASAQEARPISAEAEHELKCAILAAFLAGTVNEGSANPDPELERAMGYALTYWIGRFEGMTGRHFDDVATVDFVKGTIGELEGLRATCAPQMQEMGGRLQIWGNLLQNSEEPGGATPAP